MWSEKESSTRWTPPKEAALPRLFVPRTASISAREIEASSLEVLDRGEPTSAKWHAVLETCHSALRSQWLNGGVVFAYYHYSKRKDQTSFGVGDVIKALREISNRQWLPRELEDSSLDYLQAGHLQAFPVPRVADMIYLALSSGGAYGEPLVAGEAEELTRNYVAGLLDGAPALSLRCFALDPGFSGWFYQVAWDFAFLFSNVEKGRIVLVGATDTD